MSMERYSKYKESGVSWVGQIPEQWEIKQLRSFLSLFSEKGHGDAQLLSVTREQGVIVRDKDDKDENHNFVPDDLSGYKYIEKGDFAINKMKAWQGSYAVSCFDGIVSPAYFTCKLRGVDKEFFSRAIRSKAYVPFFTQYSKGIRVGQWDLDPNALKSIPFFLPPLPEQQKIVSYLESKTSSIDAYVAEKEKELQLLNELKEAEIAKVVTHGLNPNLKLKDSGVSFIGMIPEHWEVEPFGRHFTFGKGLPITKADLLPEGLAVISYGQIHAKTNTGVTMDESLVRRVSPSYLESHPQYLLHQDDFVFADTSEDLEGSGNFAFNDYEDDIFAGYHTLVARPIDLLCPKYYAYLFQSTKWKSQVRSLVNGVKVYTISKRILKNSYILIPTIKEQQEIVAYADEKTVKVNSLISELVSEINYLKEYKQRLIADCVTGQVNVQNI